MKYDGGKNGEGVAQWIINQLPPHETYIEPFLGSGAVLRMKRPAVASIALDCDTEAVKMITSQLKAMPAVTVICGDAISYLRKLRCGPLTLIYCDPPYLGMTRRSKQRIYRHEFDSIEQHTTLLKVLMKLPCMVALSGYRSSLYDAILRGWRRTEKVVTLRRGVKATECLWMNYPEPVALHDYRYLGDNFRERERFKRIRTNLKERLARMPLLERRALASMIAESCDDGPP